ncbi:hypothetical protein CORC01_12668 [Colletotrichum orchidophilum]|uniref:Uncharacterized protein n=1 Tax=Colletotrichum orchidophilum TaxID=1209926 RepID=A0A1G4AS97_9PEZI|nr:uncharacterized protein CORC01_12668 [Colletotrichum orchidophilum]OHE92029.1 hypothetical protein CORC01_12668 [Colletotrichum orchidophilum]
MRRVDAMPRPKEKLRKGKATGGRATCGKEASDGAGLFGDGWPESRGRPSPFSQGTLEKDPPARGRWNPSSPLKWSQNGVPRGHRGRWCKRWSPPTIPGERWQPLEQVHAGHTYYGYGGAKTLRSVLAVCH